MLLCAQLAGKRSLSLGRESSSGERSVRKGTQYDLVTWTAHSAAGAVERRGSTSKWTGKGACRGLLGIAPEVCFQRYISGLENVFES